MKTNVPQFCTYVCASLAGWDYGQFYESGEPMAMCYTAGNDYEELIRSQVNSGRYATATDALRAVVLEGLDSGGAKELKSAELVELAEPAESAEPVEPVKARGRGRSKARKEAG
jgi:Arc/MetJ-type ribon-helix-helix transcriptional regulator